MIFVIDIGNSHTVTGLYSGDQLLGQWRMKSERGSTEDELAIRYHALFAMEGLNIADISAIVIASVVPTLETAWLSCCRKHFATHLTSPVLTVSNTTVADLIKVKMPNPSEVGADRLVNAIAAYHQFPGYLIVIDFGTAITFDCVNARCEYLGGAILPGIAISIEALAQRTAKLPHIDVSDPPDTIIGTTTIEAMKSGILHGYGAMVDGLVEGIKTELVDSPDLPVKVLATGGMARIIAPYSRKIDHIDPLLTLRGLKLIYEHKLGSS